MEPYAETMTHLFATGMLCLHVVLVVTLVHRIARGSWFPKPILAHLRAQGLRYAAGLSLAGVVLSLWYSEVVGFPVCALCWFGRTMLYPLAAILPIAAWRRDANIWHYALPLSFLGMLVTGYQHLLQVGVVESSFCNVLKNGGDCVARYVFEYNYITMPLFGFTVFITVALLVWVARGR